MRILLHQRCRLAGDGWVRPLSHCPAISETLDGSQDGHLVREPGTIYDRLQIVGSRQRGGRLNRQGLPLRHGHGRFDTGQCVPDR